MFRIGHFTLGFLFLAIGSAGAGELPTVRAVYMNDAYPVAWEENGKGRGIEPEIVDYCLARLGVRAEHRFVPWGRAQEEIRAGEADLIITTPTDERFTYAVFGKEKVVIQDWSLFTHKDNKEFIDKARRFTRLEDLKPYEFVDYLGNGWTARYLKDGYKIHRVPRTQLIPGLLASKRGTFTFENAGTFMSWAEDAKVGDVMVEVKTNLPNTKFHYVFIVSRKSPWLAKGLVKGLDQELREMKKSGEWEKIVKKYRFPVESASFRSQIPTEQFYVEYEKYPEFNR